MRRVMLAVLLAALSVVPAGAAPFNLGDVLASTASGTVLHFTSAGVPVQTLTGGSSFMTGSAFDADGNFYVTNFGAARVLKYDTNGGLIGNFGSGYNSAPESIVFDEDGDVYVGQADGTRDVLRFTAGGTSSGVFDVAAEVPGRGSDWIDLAADQRTLYYTSEGRLVKRYDVLSDTQLADFGTLPGPRGPNVAFALRLLDDGGVLVADNANIKRLDSSGAHIQTYDIAGIDDWFALNLDPDGTTFWSAGIANGRIRRFNIATGAQVGGFDAGGQIFGLSIRGERTQGGGGGGGGGAPEPATLALLGAAALGFAARRRRCG